MAGHGINEGAAHNKDMRPCKLYVGWGQTHSLFFVRGLIRELPCNTSNPVPTLATSGNVAFYIKLLMQSGGKVTKIDNFPFNVGICHKGLVVYQFYQCTAYHGVLTWGSHPSTVAKNS